MYYASYWKENAKQNIKIPKLSYGSFPKLSCAMMGSAECWWCKIMTDRGLHEMHFQHRAMRGNKLPKKI